MLLNVPLAHGVQLVALPAVNVSVTEPAIHTVQFTVARALYCPAGQELQLVPPVAFSVFVTEPAGQMRQLALLLQGLNRPGAHSWHSNSDSGSQEPDSDWEPDSDSGSHASDVQTYWLWDEQFVTAKVQPLSISANEHSRAPSSAHARVAWVSVDAGAQDSFIDTNEEADQTEHCSFAVCCAYPRSSVSEQQRMLCSASSAASTV